MTHNPMSPDLVAWGATFTPAIVAPGKFYWRLHQADGPLDIGGNHHLYVDVWSESGERIVDLPVAFFWYENGVERTDTRKTEAKTGEPSSVNLPMSAGGNAYGVRVADGLPSDSLFGVGMGDRVPHHCFRAIFQLAQASAEIKPPTLPPGPQPVIVPPTPIITAKEALEYADFYLQMARRLLP